MNRDIVFRKATLTDVDELADLRVRAMEPSLRDVGRFDPIRARTRFIDSFVAENTFIAISEDTIIGFYMITESKDIKLNHLYIDPEFQNFGLGKLFINRIKEIAKNKNKIIVLETLRNSPANDFYCSQGFVQIREIEFDNIYSWTPATLII